MTKPLTAMLWALAIIFTAFLASEGVIDEDSATTLLLVLPILAAMQLTGRMNCCLQKRVSQDV